MKMKKKWKQYLTAGVCGCLLLAAAALPASAADFVADITPDMTMKQVRSDPGVIVTGVSTYDCTDATSALLRKAYENRTVEEYVGAEKAADAAESLNLAIKNYDRGVQVTWQVYTPEEIAAEMKLPVERVREILKISQEPVSLETPIGEEEDSHLGDFIQDDNVPVPADAAAFTLLKEQLVEVLSTLTDREQKVLRLRFGLDDGRARTLEEVGKEFNVTRERIRQIEAKALRKLRHPSRSRKLKDYLD